MPVTLLCPQCQRPITATHSVPTACPNCDSPLPLALLGAAEAQLHNEPEVKPLFLRALPIFLGLWAVIALPISLVFLASTGGTYTINGVEVTREEFMRRAGSMFVVFPVLALFAAAIAWGLYRNRRWARPFSVIFFLAVPLSPALILAKDPEQATPWGMTLLMAVLVAIPGIWYFYWKPNVVRYYARLREDSRPATHGS